eukprot:233902_1
MAHRTDQEEQNPLTGNNDEKKQENMVEIAGSDTMTKPVEIACNKCYNWFPLGWFAWLSGWLLIGCIIADLVQFGTNFVGYWIYVYLIVGALLILVIDCPSELSQDTGSDQMIYIRFIVKWQLMIYRWIKLFRRIWGRIILYSIIMFTCGSFLGDSFVPSEEFRSVPWIAGFYLLWIIILSIAFSFIAAKKYNMIRQYILYSTELSVHHEIMTYAKQLKYIFEDSDILKQNTNREVELRKFISKYDELDENKDGKVGMVELARLGEESGNTFSKSEKRAVMLLLDPNCNGYITKVEWIMQFQKHKVLNML